LADPLTSLAPLLPDGRIRTLILGSFPSQDSLRKQEYYGHAQNWFWRVLQACGLIDDAAAPYLERVGQLTGHRIAVWDLYASVEREGSGDDRIRNAVPNDVDGLWRERGPFPILLNGRRDREWRRHFATIPAQTVALPSTSPRPLHWNTSKSRAAAIEEWRLAFGEALAR
jgi:hypoxanthine-DNA glycosylase